MDTLNHMVERHQGGARLDRVFKALSDPTRRGILASLRSSESTIGELAAPLPMSLAAVSKHVQVLEDAGLVSRKIEGRRHVCSLDPAPLAHIDTWLEHYRAYWPERLDALQAALEAEDAAR